MISGKDFMLYFEYETADGTALNIPYCAASSVQLETTSDVQEVTKPKDSKWKFYEYGLNSYTLQLDGLVKYSLQEVQDVLLNTLKGLVKTVNGDYIKVGENVFPPVDYGYFNLENRLMNWLSVKWIMHDEKNEFITYRGEAIIPQTTISFSPDDLVKGSVQMQGQGAYEVLLLPTPTNLRYTGQSDATDTASFGLVNTSVVSGITTSKYQITGNALMNNYFQLAFNGDANGVVNRYYEPGDSYADVLTDMANSINNNSNLLSTAYYDGEYLNVIYSATINIIPLYIKTNSTVKNASFVFDTSAGFSAYTFKIINNTDNETYYFDSDNKITEIALVTGKSYTASVMGYNESGFMSDYSEPITFNF